MSSGGSPSLLERLRAFAKLYGYLRFFHPSDAAANADWDKLVCDGVAELLATEGDAPKLDEQLTRIMAAVAPTARIYPTGSVVPKLELEGSGPAVAWQHRGFGVGVFGGGFESARTGRARRQAIGRGRAAISRMIEAEQLRGSSLRMRARIRVDAREREDHGALWLRIDGPEHEALFFDNMGDRAVRDAEYREVEILAEVPADAERVAFGAIANCEGAVYFSDFRLERVDAEGKSEALAVDNLGFERGDSSGWGGEAPDFVYEVIDDAPGKTLRMARRFRTNSRTLFEPRPSEAEVRDLELGAGLRLCLPLSLPGELAVRTGEGGPRPVELDARHRVEAVAAVIVTWNVLAHFYPYFEVIDEDWGAALDGALAAASEVEDEAEGYEVLEQLVAKLHDGQARVLGPDLWTGPMRLARLRDDRIVVTAARADSGLQPGDELLSIDGVAIEDAIADACARTSGTRHYVDAVLLDECRVSEGPPTQLLDLELRRGDSVVPISVVRSPDQPPPVFARPPITTTEDGIFIVELERVLWRDIEAHLLELAVAPGVVFDLRSCSSAKLEFLSHLVPRFERHEWMFVPQLIYPHQVERTWQAFGLPIPPAQPSIGGKVAFLIGPRTIAGGESILGFVEAHEFGVRVGARSAGANGNINMFPVPGGYHVAFTGMKVTRLDGSQHHCKGFAPQIEVRMSLEGLLEGRDEVLEAALGEIRRSL